MDIDKYMYIYQRRHNPYKDFRDESKVTRAKVRN